MPFLSVFIFTHLSRDTHHLAVNLFLTRPDDSSVSSSSFFSMRACVCVLCAEDQILKEKRRRKRRRRKSTIRRASLSRSLKRVREREKRKRKEISTNVFCQDEKNIATNRKRENDEQRKKMFDV